MPKTPRPREILVPKYERVKKQIQRLKRRIEKFDEIRQKLQTELMEASLQEGMKHYKNKKWSHYLTS